MTLTAVTPTTVNARRSRRSTSITRWRSSATAAAPANAAIEIVNVAP